MEAKAVIETAEGAALVGGGILYGLTLVFGKRAKAINEAQNTLVDTLNKVIDAQDERAAEQYRQRAEQNEKMDMLTGEVRELRETVITYACPNAPFCDKRPTDGLGGLTAFSPA